MSSWRRNEAKTLRWDPCDRVLGRFDIYGDGKGGRVGTADTTLSTARVEAKMVRPARSAFHDLYQIYQVLSLHIPQWSSFDALRVWGNVSGRFLGPIT